MMLKSLHLKNILSFRDTEVALRPLNILIGPNASGKSNLIETLGVLQAAPSDLAGFFRQNGPVSDWIWKGGLEGDGERRIAEIEAVINNPDGEHPSEKSLKYAIRIADSNGRLQVVGEKLENIEPYEAGNDQPYFYLNMENGHGRVSIHMGPAFNTGNVTPFMPLTSDNFNPSKSVLSEIRDTFNFPVLTQTAVRFSSMRIYGNLNVGRNSPARRPQATDGEVDFLREDLGNLALVVNNFQGRPAGALMDEYLSRFYEGYGRLHSRVFGGSIQLTVNESGMSDSIPATRLSDGTLRFIALLTALCHPDPPDLVCIEEPELALHPDAMPMLADLLESASERTQIIATTHSPDLVDQFTANPDAIVVCERGFDGDTQMKRLSEDELSDWLEDYRLAELWKKGVIGGNRW